MKFAEDHNSARYKISAYDKQSITINEELFTDSLVMSPMELISDWTPQNYADLTPEHLEAIYRLNAEVIILGTGPTQIIPPTDILRRLVEGKIGYEVMDTQAACRTFNILMAEGRNVVAGLFLK